MGSLLITLGIGAYVATGASLADWEYRDPQRERRPGVLFTAFIVVAGPALLLWAAVWCLGCTEEE